MGTHKLFPLAKTTLFKGRFDAAGTNEHRRPGPFEFSTPAFNHGDTVFMLAKNDLKRKWPVANNV